MADETKCKESSDFLSTTVHERKSSSTIGIANERSVGHPAAPQEELQHVGSTRGPTEVLTSTLRRGETLTSLSTTKHKQNSLPTVDTTDY